MIARTVRMDVMDVREALGFSHLDGVDDTDTNMVLHLVHTKIDMGTTFSKIIDKLEEVLVVVHLVVVAMAVVEVVVVVVVVVRIIAIARGWIATEIEPTWTRCEIRHLQDSIDQRSDRSLIIGRRPIKIKTTDG